MKYKKEYHQKIFSTLGNHKKKATGISLSIVKKVVKLHKGKIWLESEISKGSIFYFSIP